MRTKIKWRMVRLSWGTYLKLKKERCEDESFSRTIDRLVDSVGKAQKAGTELARL